MSLARNRKSIMKKLLILSSLVMITWSSHCQIDSNNKWLISVNYGLEKHDKRLFDYSERTTLLESQPENWGTHHFTLNVLRRLSESNKLLIYGSLGLSYEHATFIRPFDHKHFEPLSVDILLAQNRYSKCYAIPSVAFLLKLTSRLNIIGSTDLNMLLYRYVNHTESTFPSFPYSETTLEFDKLQMNLGFNYTAGRFLIGIQSRVFNYQKVDKVIFNSIIKDPRINQRWERFNPLRFDVSVGYFL